MNPTRPDFTSAREGLEYHDYMLMMASLDAEWTRNPAKGMAAIQESFDEFQRTCHDYRDKVKENFSHWSEAGGVMNRESDGVMDDCLFNPRHWVPCGHSDALCMALIDDLDAAQTVIETYPKTVEEVCVAFCPKISHHASGSAFASIFAEPHSLFNSAPPRADEGQPLMQFARLKLQGVLTLGRALLTLEACYHLIVRRIEDALRLLEPPRLEDEAGIIVRDDLNSLKICVLDLQEEEEIGLLFFTTNLSLSMTILSHLQSLTIKDLTDLDPELAAHLEKTSHYQAIRDFAGQCLPDLQPALLPNVEDSHLLRWTRSTAAFCSRLFPPANPADAQAMACAQELGARVRGWVTPWIMINHAPGHQHELELALLDLVRDVQAHANPGKPKPPDSTYRMHVVGATDFILQITDRLDPAKPGGPTLNDELHLVSTSALVQAYVQAPKVLAAHASLPDAGHGRHMSGWSTTVGVPVPILDSDGRKDCFHPRVAHSHRPLLKELLDALRKTIFPVASREDPKEDAYLATLRHPRPPLQGWKFCIDTLRLATRIKGLPVETRRSLVVMYENFAAILSNPLLFDIVLDLYDVMATLYQILVTLPEHWDQPDPEKHPEDYTPRPSPEKVDRLNAIIAAIDSALELRQRRLYPEVRLRDWALDFRSNILQIILSAEAAMKCGVGIYRKFVRRHEGIHPDLGVVHEVAFASSIYVPENSLVSTKDQHLACFRSGVAHLTHLSGFADFFHEAFHLIFDHTLRADISDPIFRAIQALKEPDSTSEVQLESHLAWRVANNPEDPIGMGQQLVQRHSEVFVHLLMMMFIHDGDHVLALRNHAVGYSTNPRSVAEDRKDARDTFIVQFAPVLIAAMVVQVAHRQAAQPPATQQWWEADLNASHWPALDEARPILGDLLAGLFPWLADAEWLFEASNAAAHPQLLDQTVEKILTIYLDVHNKLTDLWTKTQAVYASFVKYVVVEFTDGKGSAPVDENALFPDHDQIVIFKQMTHAVDQQIKRTIAGLEPVFEPVEGAAVISQMFDKGLSVDAALLASRCLHAHIRDFIGPPGAGLCRALRRTLALQGRIDWNGMRNPSVLLMDRTATNLFCCVPGERRRRTGWRIALFKTFWDIASRNRARRLRALFTQATQATQAAQAAQAGTPGQSPAT